MDTTMLDRRQAPSLWGLWWNAMLLLRPAFSRLRTFMWFATIVAGLTVRVELLGVTSIVRALNLRPGLYTKLLKNFHSSALKLDRLAALWARCAAAVPKSAARQWPAGPGRGWHQGRQTRQENAGRQAVASTIGIQHQARVHHGAFPAGCRPARPRGSQRVLRTARRAYPRRSGMVQSRPAPA